MGVVLSRFSHLASTGKQSDPTSRLVMIPRCRKTRWLERVGHGPACAHGDTACFRILTESGIMLWRHRLLNTIASKFLSESCTCNLRSETWRRWLSACLRTHLTCAPSRNNFEGTFAGNGKKRVLFCADKTPRLNFNRVRVRAPCANSLIFKRLVKNNYVTPASSCP